MMMYVCEDCGMATHLNYGNGIIVLCDLCRSVNYEVCPVCGELTHTDFMYQSRANSECNICEQCYDDGG